MSVVLGWRCVLNTHTDNYWQVYFDTNRMILDVLGANGFPVPRIPLAMGAN